MVKAAFLVGSVSRRAGGLFDSVRRLAQTLASQEGMAVQPLGVCDDHTAADVHQWLPLVPQTFRAFGPPTLHFAPGLRAALARLEPDLVRVDGLWTYLSIACSRWHAQTRRPYLVAPRGMLDTWALANSPWKKKIAGALFERSHLAQAACLHALCEAEARAIRAYGVTTPIAIIPNGINLPDLAAHQHDQGPLTAFRAAGRKVLLYLGRIHPKKGLVNLIKAWANVQKAAGSRQQAEQWVLAMAGWDQGGHEAELKLLATELGLKWADLREKAEGRRQRVEGGGQRSVVGSQWSAATLVFLGPQFDDAKAACYADCDAFVLPSFSEGLPMAVLEAWAYGKPVLMTPQCNLPEGFAAGAAVRMEPEVPSITRGLIELTQAPDSALNALSAQGRALVAARFSWPKIAQEMMRLYHWMLGAAPKPTSLADV